jgi:hypothetical protein
MMTNTKYCLTYNPVLWLLITVDISDVEDLQDREAKGTALTLMLNKATGLDGL